MHNFDIHQNLHNCTRIIRSTKFGYSKWKDSRFMKAFLVCLNLYLWGYINNKHCEPFLKLQMKLKLGLNCKAALWVIFGELKWSSSVHHTVIKAAAGSVLFLTLNISICLFSQSVIASTEAYIVYFIQYTIIGWIGDHLKSCLFDPVLD